MDRLDIIEYMKINNFDNSYVRFFTETHKSDSYLGNLYSSQLADIRIGRRYDATRDKRLNRISMAGFTVECVCDNLELTITAYRLLASMLTIFDDTVEYLLNLGEPLVLTNKSTSDNVAMGGYLYGCELTIIPLLHGTRTHAFFLKYPNKELTKAEQLREDGLCEVFVQSCSLCSVSSTNMLGFAKIGNNGSYNVVCSNIFAQPDPKRPNVNTRKNHQNAGEEMERSCGEEDDTTECSGQNGVYVYYKNAKRHFPTKLYTECRSMVKNCFDVPHTAHTMRFKCLATIMAIALRDAVTYIRASKENPKNNMEHATTKTPSANENGPVPETKRVRALLDKTHLKSQFVRIGHMLRNGDLDRYFSKTSTFGRSDEEEQVCVNTSNSTSNGSWQMAVSGYTASQTKTNRYTYMNNHNVYELMSQFCCHKLAQKRQNRQRTFYIGPFGSDEGVLSYEFVTDSSNAGQKFMMSMETMFARSTFNDNYDCTDNKRLQFMFEQTMVAHKFVDADNTGRSCYLLFDNMDYKETRLVSMDPVHLATCAIFLTSTGYGPVDVLKLSDNVVYLTCFNFTIVTKLVGSLGMYVTPTTYMMLKHCNKKPLLEYGSLLTQVVPQITNSHTPKVIQGASNLRNMDDTFAIGDMDLSRSQPKTNSRSVLEHDPMPGCPIKNMAIHRIETTTKLDPNVSEDGFAINYEDSLKFRNIEFQHHVFDFVSVLNSSVDLKKRVKRLTRQKKGSVNIKYKMQNILQMEGTDCVVNRCCSNKNNGGKPCSISHNKSGTMFFSCSLNGGTNNDTDEPRIVECNYIAENTPLKLNETVICLTNIAKVANEKSKCFKAKHNRKVNRCNIVYTKDVYADRESCVKTYIEKESIKLVVMNNGTVQLGFLTKAIMLYENGDKICTPCGQKVTGRIVPSTERSHLCATSINRGDLGERIYGLAARLEDAGKLEKGFCSVFFGNNWVYLPPPERERVNKTIVRLAHLNGGTDRVYNYFMNMKNKARDPKSFYVLENVNRHEYTNQINKGKSGSGSSNCARSQFCAYTAMGASSTVNMILERSIGDVSYRELDTNNITVVPKTTAAFLDTLYNLDTSVKVERLGSYIENVMKSDGVWE